MRLSGRQAEAVNQIIQEEVQAALRGRREAARLNEQRQLRENGAFEHMGSPEQVKHQLHELMESLIAEVGEDAAYETVMDAFSSAAKEVASGVDSDEEPAGDRGYPGGSEEVELPPMHPRGR